MRGNVMRYYIYALAVSTALTTLALEARAADYAVPSNNTTPSAPPQDNSNLLNLSLQQLSDVEVTSVSKKAEKASQAAAAIYVITQEDIRRSGLQSVPELLRMVPGLQVAQSGSQNWAITSRGFNGQFANKLLVLIDGRTVYGAVFSGVFWDVQNLMLEDIDRIEVIRGPGATLWGANAVNGVINIITKSAKDTQGTLLTGATGNQERVAAGARYGGQQGDLAYRTYAQYFNDNQQHNVPAAGVPSGGAGDQWQNGQGGFRLDWSTSEKEIKTLQGDAYEGQEDTQRFLPVTSSVSPNFIRAVNDTDDVSGANILGRWTHEIHPGSDVTFQAYYDDVNRSFEDVGSSIHTQTFDTDFQHNLKLDAHNDLTWGLGYRFTNSGFGNGFYISFAPEDFNENLFSGFVQDKMALVPDKVFLTFGTKLEHNDFSGFEYEPSVRLSWIPTENQTVWAALSRAVRALTQGDQNQNIALASLPTPAPYNAIANSTIVSEIGSPNTMSEDVTSYELGYRIQPRENLSFDLTGFVNEYDHLDSLAPGNPSVAYDAAMGYYIVQPEISQNLSSGETHGLEFATTWEATKQIKFSGSYSVFYSAYHIVGASLTTAQGTSPQEQFNIRSYVDMTHDVQFDTMLYYVNGLPGLDIPGYTRLDTRLGWAPIKGLDLSLIGQNLLQSEHEEYSPFIYQAQEEIGRSVIAKATLRF